jgi:hypothetical protein
MKENRRGPNAGGRHRVSGKSAGFLKIVTEKRRNQYKHDQRTHTPE